MVRVLLCAGALLALLGCGPKSEEPSKLTKVNYRPGIERHAFITEEPLTVRTFTSALSDRKEFAGARCRAASSELSVEFITPATLMVPRFQRRPSDLQIWCQSAFGNGQITVRPFFPNHPTTRLNPLVALTLTTLATAFKGHRTQWTYVPTGGTRSVTLQWASRPS